MVPFGFRELRKGAYPDGTRVLALDWVKEQKMRGGTLLPTHRASAVEDSHAEAVVRALQAQGIHFLIAVGGDDTGSSAAAVSRAAARLGYELHVVHLPKTIDGDLWHRRGLKTFGLDTAAEEYARVLKGLGGEMVSNPDRAFLLESMGRDAGILGVCAARKAMALGAKPLLTLIPEMFPDKIPLGVIRDIIAGALIKNFARTDTCGVVFYSEALPLICTEASVCELIAGVPLDEHRHPKLSEVPFARTMAGLLRKQFAEIGFLNLSGKPVDVTPVEDGYGPMRCGDPNEFDQAYTLAIGAAAVEQVLRGEGAGSVWYDANGQVEFVPFAESVDPETKRMRTRQANWDDYQPLIAGGVPWFTAVDLNDAEIRAKTSLSQYQFSVMFAGAAAALAGCSP